MVDSWAAWLTFFHCLFTVVASASKMTPPVHSTLFQNILALLLCTWKMCKCVVHLYLCRRRKNGPPVRHGAQRLHRKLVERRDAFGRKGFLVCCTANGINTKNKPLAHYSIPDIYLKTQMPVLPDISEASLIKTDVRSILIRSRT